MKKLPLLACTALALVTGLLVVKAQVPGVNSTLNTVFTLVYDQSTMKATYSGSGGGQVGTTQTLICVLQGSATRNIRVRRILISGGATAVATDPIAIWKQSTPPSTATGVPGTTAGAYVVSPLPGYDSSNSAATAIMDFYFSVGGAAPTVTFGTIVGALADVPLTFNNYTTGVGSGLLTINFGERGSPVVLRSASETIAVGSGGPGTTTTFPAGTEIRCTFEWTEEAPGNG